LSVNVTKAVGATIEMS